MQLDPSNFALQAIKVLFIGRLNPGGNMLLMLYRIKGLLPTYEGLATLIGKGNFENEVVVFRNVLHLDPIWWFNGLEDIHVWVVGAIRSMQNELPRTSGS